MNILKRRITALALLIIMLTQFTVFGQGEIKYGDTIKLLRMSGVFPNREFWNMYAGREACEFSTEKAYRGGTSLKVDVNKIMNTEKKCLNFETQKVNPSAYGADTGPLYFEWYVYGLDEDIFADRVSFSVAFTYPDGTQKIIRDKMTYEQPNENGWVKVWLPAPKELYGDISYCTMGVYYDPSSSGTVPLSCFYLDEMAIRVLPSAIEINDISAEKSVNLNSVRVFGKDYSGKKNLIETKSFINHRVVSGDAEINGESMVYTGAGEGSAVVECEYFGITTDFTINFKANRNVTYSDLSINSDESISLTVYNMSRTDISSDVIFALYDGERLYSVQTVKTNISASESAQIKSSPLRVSANIAEPVIKVFAWDSQGGFEILK